MKINVTYNLTVRSPDGVIKSVMQTPGHSFVRGFLEVLYTQMTGNTFSVRDTDGIMKSVVGPDINCLDVTHSGAVRGIVVGGGTGAVEISDSQLATLRADGTGTDEFTHGTQTYLEPTVTEQTAQFSILRSFTNGSGDTITVGEVGLLGDGSTTTDDFLFVREVLPAVLSVPDTDVLDVVCIIQITSAIDVQDSDVGEGYIKTADETVNNSSTLQDDDHLAFSVVAGEHIYVECHFVYDSSSIADIKFGLTYPVGATSQWGSSAGFEHPLEINEVMSVDDLNAQADVGLHITMFIKVGSNAGTVQLQWAQDTAEVSNTVLQEGSAMIVHRL